MKRLALLLLTATLTIGCRKPSQVAAKAIQAESEPESITNWTNQTELFMEYPPLVAGQTSRFAIHLTRLDNFKPFAAGTVEVRLTRQAGNLEPFKADAPSRPGIFGVDVTPSRAGEFQLTVSFNGEGISDVHKLGKITSFPTKKAVLHEQRSETEEKIAFLKEQQWTLDFATAIAEDQRMQSSLRVPGEILPRSGGEADVTAPFDGRLIGASLPVVGARLMRGQILANIFLPTNAPSDLATLELAKNEANAVLQLARKDRERAERLVVSGAAPQKRLDEARTVEATAEARLSAAEARLTQYDVSSIGEGNSKGAKLFALRAPISGVLIETTAAPGANVKAGQSLFKIVDADTVYASAVVPEPEFHQIRSLSGAELEIPGSQQPCKLHRLVSVGRVVDPASRTFPVIYEFDNRERRVAVHQAVHVRLLTAASNVAPAVPESAIVDDAGRPIVFVQVAGENFVRRPVRLGIRQGGMVQVLDGVLRGERVVTRGAHLVRLATMSSQVPAHGHVH